MSIQATCPRCLTIYEFPDSDRGQQIRCRRCSQMVPVGGKHREPFREPIAPDSAYDRTVVDVRLQEDDFSRPPPVPRLPPVSKDRPPSRSRRNAKPENGGHRQVLILLGIFAGAAAFFF